MNEYTGAVFFVDILGVGELTQGKINITEIDFDAHKFPYKENFSEHQFCAKLLLKFRRNLVKATTNKNNVKVAQLSDCAFIWSSDLDMVVDVARDIMWKLTLDGILCRGGIAYGQIVEPEKINVKLGNFICGGAATEAVKLERMGKGARVFVKSGLKSELKNIPLEAFTERKSTIDFSIVNEFLWYKYPKTIQSECDLCSDKRVLRGLIKLIAVLKFSPTYRWNVSSAQGLHQIASTLDIISLETENFTHNLDLRCSFEYVYKHGDIIRSKDLHKKNLKSYLKEYRNNQNVWAKYKKTKNL